MSGHSKWSKVKNQKGAADAKRGQIFSKLAKAIAVAAKDGGGDPSFNFKLRLQIDRAKAANMPKDAIERAIARGTGESNEATITSVMYEGFAPGGAAILVDCLTDNSNRTLSEVRQVFTKRGGNFGNEGSVRWQFKQMGIITANGTLSEDQELELIDAGAVDVERGNDVTIFTSIEDLQKVQEVAEKIGLKIEDGGLGWTAKQKMKVPTADLEKFEQFIAALENLDDVQDVYDNAS